MERLIEESVRYPSITLNQRKTCDLELLLNGAFHPLTGFLRSADYNSVVENCRLSNGKLWSMPIVLAINESDVEKYTGKDKITLKCDQELPVAIMSNIEIYKPDLLKECSNVYGTTDTNHPYVAIVMEDPNVYYIGGELTKIQDIPHYDFKELRLTPHETKKYFAENGWTKVLGFQTRNPMHRSHLELTLAALRECGEDAKLLLHPVVGITQECDIEYHTRVRCYKKLIGHYPENTAALSLLPLSMRMAGPREALWHAQIRQNYGCTHFVVGRDHAGPSYKTKDGQPFYGPYDAHEILEKYASELSIKVIKSKMIVYVEDTQSYMPIDEVPKGMNVLNISGTQQREMLSTGADIPEWFSYPDIVEELRKDFVPASQRGFCVYLVGLSGSGKSTIANILKSKLKEFGDHRRITLLDADIIRQHLSKGLGFSKADRSMNVRRIGYVASEIAKHGGICICANIAPYKEDREFNRALIEEWGDYIQVFVDTNIKVCEKRDVKGLYKMARNGIIKEFTGVSDPFEDATESAIVLDGDSPLENSVNAIVDEIKRRSLL